MMVFSAKIALITGLFSMSFILNAPLGYLRSKVRKYSVLWFAYIHLSIPFIAAGRIFSDLDWRYIPIFLAAAVMGQLYGGKLDF